MPGKMPNFRAIVKVGEKRWAKIGAGWANNDKISVQLEQTPIPANGKVRFLLVPNVAKKAAAAPVAA